MYRNWNWRYPAFLWQPLLSAPGGNFNHTMPSRDLQTHQFHCKMENEMVEKIGPTTTHHHIIGESCTSPRGTSPSCMICTHMPSWIRSSATEAGFRSCLRHALLSHSPSNIRQEPWVRLQRTHVYQFKQNCFWFNGAIHYTQLTPKLCISRLISSKK